MAADRKIALVLLVAIGVAACGRAATTPAPDARYAAVVDPRHAGPDGARIGGVPTFHTIGAALAAARFFEYRSAGPGAVAHPARRRLTDAEARNFTVDKVLGGWKP